MLNRMVPPLKVSGFLHMSQSAYQQGISCADVVFAALLKFTREGDTP